MMQTIGDQQKDTILCAQRWLSILLDIYVFVFVYVIV